MRAFMSGLLATMAVALVGCGVGQVAPQPIRLDLGAPPPATDASRVFEPIVLPALNAARVLSTDGVIWREGDDGMPQRYATYKWISPPSVLVRERLFEQLSQYGPVLTEGLGDSLPVLRVSLMQFEQVYAPDGKSNQGVVTVQAVLTRQGKVLGQIRLTERKPATSSSAPAGATALRIATDRLIEQLGQWIERTL